MGPLLCPCFVDLPARKNQQTPPFSHVMLNLLKHPKRQRTRITYDEQRWRIVDQRRCFVLQELNLCFEAVETVTLAGLLVAMSTVICQAPASSTPKSKAISSACSFATLKVFFRRTARSPLTAAAMIGTSSAGRAIKLNRLAWMMFGASIPCTGYLGGGG